MTLVTLNGIAEDHCLSISVLVLTLNEEINIRGCLGSVDWCDDVVVLDSFSTDSTLQVAQELGVRVVQRKFDNYANQRNYGLSQIKYRHPWVLMLDADERVPIELRDELLSAVGQAQETVAMFSMRRKDHLFGRWIKGASGYPTWFGRLGRIGRVSVERPINEEYRAAGLVVPLRSHLHHYPFNKGFAAWFAKHDKYSTMEAALRAERSADRWLLRELVSADPGIRRRSVKAFAYNLPARPLIMFVALYILRGGILEGRAGLTFSLLRAWYEYMIDCKLIELRRRARGMPV